jgi:hypothetical protein
MSFDLELDWLTRSTLKSSKNMGFSWEGPSRTSRWRSMRRSTRANKQRFMTLKLSSKMIASCLGMVIMW